MDYIDINIKVQKELAQLRKEQRQLVKDKLESANINPIEELVDIGVFCIKATQQDATFIFSKLAYMQKKYDMDINQLDIFLELYVNNLNPTTIIGQSKQKYLSTINEKYTTITSNATKVRRNRITKESVLA